MAYSKNFMMMISFFLIAILGVVFIQTTSDPLAEQTGTLNVVNESITISTARIAGNEISNGTNFTVTFAPIRTNNSAISGFVLKNGTGFVISGGADGAGSNYTVNLTAGTFRLLNTTYMVSGGGKLNTTLVDYTYFGYNYIDDPSARSLTTLILILFVVGLIVALIVILARGDDRIKGLIKK